MVWEIFRRYHYLNTELNTSAKTFIGCINGVPVAHMGFLRNPLHKGLIRGHRLVVLPDYQGIGVGVKFATMCADEMMKEGSAVQIITTTPAIVGALTHSGRWWLKDYGRRKPNTQSKLLHKSMKTMLDHSTSKYRITYSFFLKEREPQ